MSPYGTPAATAARSIKGLLIGGIAALVLLVGTCMSTNYIEPGAAGVVINNTGGGVERRPLGPGWHFRVPGVTRIEEYPVKMQTLVLEAGDGNRGIDVTTIEGQPVSLDVSLSFELAPNKVPALYETFRSDIETVTHSYVTQTVRSALQEAVGEDSVANVLGKNKERVRAQVERELQQRLGNYGFVIRQFTINALRPPKSVEDAINARNVMTQQAMQAQNALLKTKAIADGDSIAAAGRAKALLTEARAQAEAAELLARAGSNSNYILVKQLEVQRAAVDRWDGKLPQQLFGGRDGGAVPFINVSPRQ